MFVFIDEFDHSEVQIYKKFTNLFVKQVGFGLDPDPDSNIFLTFLLACLEAFQFHPHKIRCLWFDPGHWLAQSEFFISLIR
jgi:hypothetical protein